MKLARLLELAGRPEKGEGDVTGFADATQFFIVLGLANAGSDLHNSVKAAAEFGVNRKMRMTAMMQFLSDTHTMGLQAINQAFDLMHEGKSIRSVVNFADPSTDVVEAAA